jgi:dihydroorotate dehydrogenase
VELEEEEEATIALTNPLLNVRTTISLDISSTNVKKKRQIQEKAMWKVVKQRY